MPCKQLQLDHSTSAACQLPRGVLCMRMYSTLAAIASRSGAVRQAEREGCTCSGPLCSACLSSGCELMRRAPKGWPSAEGALCTSSSWPEDVWGRIVLLSLLKGCEAVAGMAS